MPITRALLSVSDKSGLAEFATELNALGVQLLSTGGTAKALREAGLPVTDVSDYTGAPELFEGRVKTLHPKVHGGLLHKRDDAEHLAQAKEHDIPPIDLVVVNLYPFEETVAKPNVTLDDAIASALAHHPRVQVAEAALVRAQADVGRGRRATRLSRERGFRVQGQRDHPCRTGLCRPG
ncbi:MAG: hypothetical protein WCH40_01370 [Verrucomicrobiales bacterium]